MLKKNIFYLFIVQGGNYLIPLITFPYLLRVLGPVSFGLFGFFQATIQYFILFIEYGFNWTATETVAKNKNNTIVLTKLFWGFFWAKSLLAIISVILLFVICMLFDIFNQNFIVIIAFLPLIIGNVIYPVWFFQGIEEMKWITISTLLARIIVIPMTFVFVRDMGDVWIAALIQSCAVFLSGVISIYIIARGKWISGFDFDLLIINKCLTDGWHLFVSTSAISLYTTSTAIILGAMISPIAVGYYNAANTIRGATQGLLNPIAQAIYPRICFMISNNYNNALQLIKKTFKYFCGISFFCSLCLFFFASPIIQIVAGSSYVNSISVLRWMAFIPFIVAISNVFGVQTMLTHGYKKEFGRILIYSGVMNITIIFPLVYFYQENGAAISLLLTESFVTIMMYFFLKKKKINLI